MKDQYDIAEEQRLEKLRARKREQLAREAVEKVERDVRARRTFAAKFRAIGFEFAGVAHKTGRKTAARLSEKCLDAANLLEKES